MPKKQPLVVDDPEKALENFEMLTRRLLSVSREDLERKLKQYEARKKNRRRNTQKPR